MDARGSQDLVGVEHREAASVLPPRAGGFNFSPQPAFKNFCFVFGFRGEGREITLRGGHIQAHAGDALLHIAECVEATQLVSSHPVRAVVQRDKDTTPVAA